MTQGQRVVLSQIAAALAPFVALALQWMLGELVGPYVWVLFFPVVIFSAWVAGPRAGLLATAVSTVIGWWFFVPRSTRW